MIQDYDIIFENNEEVLYLYMNFNQEFAKEDTKKKSINKVIEDYIQENKIVFNGEKVGIIVGDILIATVHLNRPAINNKTLPNLELNYQIQIDDKEANSVATQPLEKRELNI